MIAVIAPYKKPICILLLSLMIAIGLLLYSWVLREQAIASYKGAVTEYRATLVKTHNAAEDAEFINSEGVHFDRLLNSGLIGSTDRIVWVNALEKLQSRMKFMQLSYKMAPAESLIDSSLFPGIETEVHQVQLSLNLGFRHDGDLYLFFTTLYEELNATFEITALEIHRSEEIAVDSEDLPGTETINLTAICQISWYTVKPHRPHQAHST